MKIEEKKVVETAVYKSRFWILLLFSSTSLLQTAIWGTFGPIIDSVQAAFGWQDRINAILQSWGPIMAVTLMVPLIWFSQTYGPRKGILLASGLMAFGTLLRCFTSSDTPFTILANIAAILNGSAGCLILSFPAMISSTWFPPNERTTATATALLSARLGGAGMNLLPLVVTAPSDNLTDVDVTIIKSDIMRLMYIGCAIVGFVFICILIYFPDAPPKPPSISSANSEKIEYFSSIKLLLKNYHFLLVAVTYGFSYGIPAVWISIMNFNLGCVGLKQEEVGWIAIAGTLASAVAGWIVARVTDHVYGHLRKTIMVLLFCSAMCYLWFLLIEFQIITMSKGQIYASIVGGLALGYAAVPLLIELGVELAHPCPPSVVVAFMVFMFNFLAAIFLLLFTIPSDCYYWSNFVLVACSSLTLLPMMLVKEKHNRSFLDRDNL